MVQAYGRFGGWQQVGQAIGGAAKTVWSKVGDDVLDAASTRIQQAAEKASAPAVAKSSTGASTSGATAWQVLQQAQTAKAAEAAAQVAAAQPSDPTASKVSSGLPWWLVPGIAVVAVGAAAMAAGRR